MKFHATKIMGIINCTPDSFSGDGKKSSAAALRHARTLIRQGADILDIGGESTRPGAKPVSFQEEIRRVIPVIKALSHSSALPISIDTSKMEVAQLALDAGASIVNNVQAMRMNKSFLKMVRDYNASVVIMHMRGNPSTMLRYASYKNVVNEVIEELKISIEKCLAIGIKKDKIIIDPGIGFAKRAEHNLMLINQLHRLKALGFPILLGVSRKSFIGQILVKSADERLLGSAAAVAVAVVRGADIVRVHDVKAIKETVKVAEAILNARC